MAKVLCLQRRLRGQALWCEAASKSRKGDSIPGDHRLIAGPKGGIFLRMANFLNRSRCPTGSAPEKSDAEHEQGVAGARKP